MQTIAELNANFAIADVLSFEEIPGGLSIARITSKACSATLFLHGAHLVHWQPEGQEPVLFLSEQSEFAPGKPIRGGVPVIFPWFGPRTGERTDGPSHGFARTTVWEVAFAALSGDDVHLTLTLAPDDQSRSLGFDHFRLAYEVVLGSTLTLRLSVANLSSGSSANAPLHFEEALHTYLAVGDVRQVSIEGLGGTEFLDKTDGFKRKTQDNDELTLDRETDRPYLNTVATVTVADPAGKRSITVEKRHSKSTVVWNPWAEVAVKLPDLPDDAWPEFVCVETANVMENSVTLQPGEAHTMEARFVLAPLAEAAETVDASETLV